MTVFRDITFRAAGPASERSRQASEGDHSRPARFGGSDEESPSDKPGAGIHSQKFGEILKAEMDKIGLSCEHFVGKGSDVEDLVKFFVKYLKPKGSWPAANAQ